MTNTRLTLEDGTTIIVPLQESAFGLDPDTLAAHGEVVSATIIQRYDDGDGGPVAAGRAARSLVRASR